MSNLVLKALLGVFAASAISFAADAAQPFDGKLFQQAQAAGKTILIDVTAPWCPTCRQQRPIVESIEKERPTLVVYEIDFDSAKPLLETFGVRHQSTLIVFKGANEVGRSVGATDPARIGALVGMGF